MIFDHKFYQLVETLKAPRAGTELMGPLLYSLVRSTKPETILEVGMGYTTPFISQALHDNAEDFINELNQLKDKNKKYLSDISGEDTLILRQGSKPLKLMHEWIADAPFLASPEYYTHSYKPIMHAIDNFSSENSYACKVKNILEQLQLDKYICSHEGDFRDFKKDISKMSNSLDFIWFDCGNAEDYKDFIEIYWDMIKPNGGLLLLHSTLNRYSYYSVLSYFKQLQNNLSNSSLEVLSLLEPHKLTQGSVTLIRKIRPEIPRFPIENAYTLLDSIRKVT